MLETSGTKIPLLDNGQRSIPWCTTGGALGGWVGGESSSFWKSLGSRVRSLEGCWVLLSVVVVWCYLIVVLFHRGLMFFSFWVHVLGVLWCFLLALFHVVWRWLTVFCSSCLTWSSRFLIFFGVWCRFILSTIIAVFSENSPSFLESTQKKGKTYHHFGNPFSRIPSFGGKYPQYLDAGNLVGEARDCGRSGQGVCSWMRRFFVRKRYGEKVKFDWSMMILNILNSIDCLQYLRVWRKMAYILYIRVYYDIHLQLYLYIYIYIFIYLCICYWFLVHIAHFIIYMRCLPALF